MQSAAVLRNLIVYKFQVIIDNHRYKWKGEAIHHKTNNSLALANFKFKPKARKKYVCWAKPYKFFLLRRYGYDKTEMKRRYA